MKFISPSSQLFRIMDKDQNGFILLKEFWDVMIVFAKGSLRDRAKLIFDIYDISQSGVISEKDLNAVIGWEYNYYNFYEPL